MGVRIPSARHGQRVARAGWRGARLAAGVPLWGRLTAAVACLAGAAAVVIIVAGLSVVRANLVRQADLQLQAAASRLDGHAVLSGLNPGPMSSAVAVGGLRVEVLGAAGQWVMPDGWGTATSGPAVPARPAWVSAHAGRPVTLPGRDGGQSWRVVVEPIRYRAQRILYAYGANDFTLVLTSRSGTGLPAVLVVGTALGGIGQAVGRLATEGFAVSLAVILAAAVLTALVTRAILSRSVAAVLTRTGAGPLTQAGPTPEPASPAPGGPGAAARDREDRMRRALIHAMQELRGPLNVIGGFAEYYRQRGQTGTGDHGPMMRRVADEAARMGATVDALAAGAEPGSGAPSGADDA